MEFIVYDTILEIVIECSEQGIDGKSTKYVLRTPKMKKVAMLAVVLVMAVVTVMAVVYLALAQLVATAQLTIVVAYRRMAVVIETPYPSRQKVRTARCSHA